MRARRIFFTVVGAVLAVSAARGGDTQSTLKSVGEGLACQCGCNQTVNGCNHIQCESRTEMQAMIQKEIQAGKDETGILQDFVLRYGVKVLSTPPARGFNRFVWILPSLGLVVGLVAVIAITRRWRKPPPAQPAALASSVDPKVLVAVEEEMEKSGIRD